MCWTTNKRHQLTNTFLLQNTPGEQLKGRDDKTNHHDRGCGIDLFSTGTIKVSLIKSARLVVMLVYDKSQELCLSVCMTNWVDKGKKEQKIVNLSI